MAGKLKLKRRAQQAHSHFGYIRPRALCAACCSSAFYSEASAKLDHHHHQPAGSHSLSFLSLFFSLKQCACASQTSPLFHSKFASLENLNIGSVCVSLSPYLVILFLSTNESERAESSSPCVFRLRDLTRESGSVQV